MAKNLLAALFGGTKHDKDMRRLQPIVESVNAQSSWAEGLTRDDMVAQTMEWRRQLCEGTTSLDRILPQAFAMAREASWRVLGERHFDVQIMGAIVLHQGDILEMKTGEGKTLTCVPAAYLNALPGKGVHVVTVNEYLAARDASWMGPVYEYLGLTTGVVMSNQDVMSKRKAYQCDITYGTNNELGFDYLRDNMSWSLDQKVQRGHAYCIVDEIDSILIDEARTPLIISGQAEDDSKQVKAADGIVKFLKECEKNPETGEYYELTKMEMLDRRTVEAFDERGDYRIDEKSKNVTFTKQGIDNLERILRQQGLLVTSTDEEGNDVTSIYDDGNFEMIHYCTEAVVAHRLYERDVDYVVNDGQVEIVDQFTGRVLPGRRYSGGLHQAIEAKEGVKILGQSKTFATITFQNFFRMYSKLSGMTGTADTEANEFKQIYDLDVVVVPTNRPVQRKDLPDLIYYNEEMKFNAIVEEVKRIHATGQPVLVGTVSIEKSEALSKLFRRAGIQHEVLNAKNHAREAFIIGEAGSKGAVTISTNMAGRGTDIKLGGSPEHMALKKVGSEAAPEELRAAVQEIMPQWRKNYEEVKALGGLYIIGSERHESAARYAPVGRLQSDDAAERGRLADRPAGVTSERSRRETCGHTGRRAARRTARNPLRIAWIRSLLKCAVLAGGAHRELIHVQTAERDESLRTQSRHRRRVVRRNHRLKNLRRAGAGLALRNDAVLDADRNAVIDAQSFPRRTTAVRLLCGAQNALPVEFQKRLDDTVFRVDARQIGRYKFDRSTAAGGKLLRKRVNRPPFRFRNRHGQLLPSPGSTCGTRIKSPSISAGAFASIRSRS